jgi:putative transposase
MTKKWTNENLAGALHFVTGNISDRKPVFHQKLACQTFLEELQNLRTKREAKLVAFVVMPDYFHFIVNPRDGKIREWTGTLKSLTAKRLLNSGNQFWQESFKALALWSTWMIWQKINYIHANPVKARLVKSAGDYYGSSFTSFYGEQSDALLNVDKDWWWPDDVQKLERAMNENL